MQMSPLRELSWGWSKFVSTHAVNWTFHDREHTAVSAARLYAFQGKLVEEEPTMYLQTVLSWQQGIYLSLKLIQLTNQHEKKGIF